MPQAELILLEESQLPTFFGWKAYELFYPDGSEDSPEDSILPFGTVDLKIGAEGISNIILILNLSTYLDGFSSRSANDLRQHAFEITQVVVAILQIELKQNPSLDAGILISDPSKNLRLFAGYPFDQRDFEGSDEEAKQI